MGTNIFDVEVTEILERYVYCIAPNKLCSSLLQVTLDIDTRQIRDKYSHVVPDNGHVIALRGAADLWVVQFSSKLSQGAPV